MLKVVIYGLGKDFDSLWPLYLQQQQKGYFKVVGMIDETITSKNVTGLEGIPIVPRLSKEFLNGVNFVIISSSIYYWEMLEALRNLNFPSESIIDGKIFLLKDFDFKMYLKNDLLNFRFFDRYLQDITYSSQKRTYYERNGKIRVTLGRKSYIGGMFVEFNADFFDEASIEIGNYTSISQDIHCEMGLNLDHDYNRVLNYGVSHLVNNYMEYFQIDKHIINRIKIGADVWVGRGCIIKSGITIGDGAVLASNSMVTKDVAPFSIMGGNPARLIKYRFDKATIAALLKLKWWNWPEEKIICALPYLQDPKAFLKQYS